MFLPRSVPPNQKDEKGNAFHHLMIAYSKYACSLHVLITSISALIDRGVDINMYNEDGVQLVALYFVDILTYIRMQICHCHFL
jgi:hypothetical protein